MFIYLHTLPMTKILYLADLSMTDKTFTEYSIGKDWFFKIYLN